MEGFSIISVVRGLLGILSILGIAWLFSVNRKAINWKVIGIGFLIQIVLAVGVLYIPAIGMFFEFVGKIFVKILDFSKAGANFVLGDLVDLSKSPYVFLFQILPTIIFFSALTSLLYYLGVVQWVIVFIAKGLKRALNVSGAEGLNVAGNVFLGMSEAPLLTKRYLPNMTPSEIFLILTAGMATIAGSVLAAYVGMLGGDDPAARLFYAKHLLSASVMAAPAAILIAKIIVPQTEEFASEMLVDARQSGSTILGVITDGTTEGIRLAVNIAGMLLVFIAMMAMVNYVLSDVIGYYTGLNGVVQRFFGSLSAFNMEFLLGLIFTPLSWLMGVCVDDMHHVGQLIGKKLILNEFVAYGELDRLIEIGAFAQQKSILMSTYILCGFANVSSIGICIGAIGSLAPNQKGNLTRFGFRAMIGGALASCLSATIVGMLL